MGSVLPSSAPAPSEVEKKIAKIVATVAALVLVAAAVVIFAFVHHQSRASTGASATGACSTEVQEIVSGGAGVQVSSYESAVVADCTTYAEFTQALGSLNSVYSPFALLNAFCEDPTDPNSASTLCSQAKAAQYASAAPPSGASSIPASSPSPLIQEPSNCGPAYGYPCGKTPKPYYGTTH